jgi:hypothetical protein
LSVTINKCQKPGHFCKIKKPPDTILKPEKENMSWKTRMYGNPNLATSQTEKVWELTLSLDAWKYSIITTY